MAKKSVRKTTIEIEDQFVKHVTDRMSTATEPFTETLERANRFPIEKQSGTPIKQSVWVPGASMGARCKSR